MSLQWCFVSLVVMTSAPLHLVSCSQMDPHVFPDKGSYFEGWYMRISDFSKETSIGWIFSRLQSKESDGHNSHNSHAASHNHTTFVTCTRAACTKSFSCPVKVTHLVSSGPKSKLSESHVLLPGDCYVLTKNSLPIDSNPDVQSPAGFEAKMGDYINFIVRPNETTFSISVGERTFRGETTSPVPWGPNGEGPESWLGNLNLPVQWFVYSLRSEVKHYEYINHETGRVIRGRSEQGKPVVAHIEKNWGGAFPKAWIWAQGVNPTNNVSFVFSSGILHRSILSIKAELSGYKNPIKKIDCKFHTLNSVHVLEHDGCKGFAKLRAEGPLCAVIFHLSVDPSLLSSCLTTPQATGYGIGCVESYNAVANVTVLQRQGLKMVLTDSQVITMAALEFGGTFMCNGQCTR